MADSSVSPALPRNIALIIGGILSSLAALLHVAVIWGGPEWYRFFGAGEKIAQMAERGEITPTIVTLAITAGLAIWAAYAFAGSGLIRRLPFMRLCLTGISFIYLARALGGLAAVVFMENPYLAEEREQVTFTIVSSVIVLIYGLAYAIGTAQIWPVLTPPPKETDTQQPK